jgi:hypothetical protein
MNDKIKIALAVTGVAVVAYTIGYHHSQKKLLDGFGQQAAKEALIYLATHDHIHNRFGR